MSSACLRLGLDARDLEHIEADLATTAFFREDRPLRGQAGRIDWRLRGLVSRLLQQGHLCGEVGEALLVPSAGCLRSPRLLLLGLGSRPHFEPSSAAPLMRDLVARSLALRAERVALALPGIVSAELGQYARGLLEGALEAMAEAAHDVELRLVAREMGLARAFETLEGAAAGLSGGAALQLVAPAAAGPLRARISAAPGG